MRSIEFHFVVFTELMLNNLSARMFEGRQGLEARNGYRLAAIQLQV